MIKKINHVWLFFTDRCNLGCGYCFYKYRTQSQVIALKTFENILKFVRPMAPMEFVFSGGEPLMDAARLKEMIAEISGQGLNRYMSVQTNATLLNEELMEFFLTHGVNLEVGIDGDETTTQRNRPGIGPYYYADIVRGVNLVLRSQGPYTTTMVVHPSGAAKLFDNLKYLAAMGLKSIEVHPAFLEVWDKAAAGVFLDQYRRACAWELKEGRHGLIGRGYSEPSRGAWDLLSVPSGKVLANWLLLSFPEEVRECLYLMDFSQGPSGEPLAQAGPYFKALQEHLAGHPNCSYRSISNFNALQAVKTPPGRRYEERVRAYIDLCEQIEAIDHKIMGATAWQP
ncbi:MAG: radical SAM protein [Candidatus Omnitrophica bacterium]|nr:radical SAM protein [Candidatus Omnitrophota bacterium]MDE2214035.1 radical SAM protein [Candidatus Omnitrophota bacterium]MDE2230987.1 radical SAM protein [Candidatus Omnitrophota bacterium]